MSSPSPTPFMETMVPADADPAVADRHKQTHTVLERGATVGRYVVIERLGAGGMGIVYAAFDPELDRKVALKLLRPDRRKRSEVARARLLREAQAMARLSHPCVVAVHDVGTFEDQIFVAMEFVDGVDLGVWLGERKRHWREVLDAFRMAGEGLAAAHDAGVVHRDFKPENVLVGRDGRIRVVDFGLARAVGDDDRGPADAAGERSPPAVEPPEGAQPTLSTRLTQVGAVVGTPPYMAPEQHRGEAVDARTDQFSFCVALYEALYGHRPFTGNTLPELAYNVLSGNVREPPREGPVPPTWLRRVLLRGLEVDPAARWPDMRALLAALARDPSVRRRKGLVVGGVALTASTLALAVWRPDTTEAPCRGVERKWAEIWDPSVQQAVRRAFLATGRPYAPDAVRWVSAQLDEYTTRWNALHTEACEATAIRKEQSQDLLDRQMLCLEKRRKEVRALTTFLREADDEVVLQSVRAVARLPSIEPCGDREALMSDAPPLSGDVAERVAQVDARLAEGRQLLALARHERALEVTRDALGAARTLEHAPSEAEAMVLLGEIFEASGDAGQAEATLLRAVWLADAARLDHLRARAWTHLVWTSGVRHQRYDEADRYRQHAIHALRRAGGDPELESLLHNNVGAVARRRGSIEDAIREHRQALRIRREHLPADDPRIAESLLNLANTLAGADQVAEAETVLSEAQAIIETVFGASHPRTASALHTRGVIAYQRGNHALALELLERATAIRKASLPDHHPDLAGSLHDLGWVLLEAGRVEDAIEPLSRAVALRRARLGDDHPRVANSLTALGLARLGTGDPTSALEPLEQALRIREASGTEPLDLAETRFALARALGALGDPARLPRAHALAEQARTAYAESGDGAQADTIRAWLEATR